MTRRLRLVVTPSGASAGAALQAVDLNCVFKTGGADVKVLHDLTFEVKEGELVCLLGPSGCGKSTLLKIIAGFLAPSSGRVLVQGRAVVKPGADRGVVFQEDALFPWLTAAENIAFGLKGRLPGKALAAEVTRYLELVGLSPFRDYLPRQLSGGMKQRVAMARVLILKPQLLLMDEPFGALDAQTREEMQTLLLSLWAELGHTILFVTHDINEAVFLADRVLVMEKGPGRIRREMRVALPRPRRKEGEAFHRWYRQIRSELRSEDRL